MAVRSRMKTFSPKIQSTGHKFLLLSAEIKRCVKFVFSLRRIRDRHGSTINYAGNDSRRAADKWHQRRFLCKWDNAYSRDSVVRRVEFSEKTPRELQRLDAQKFNGLNLAGYCYAQHAVECFHILERKKARPVLVNCAHSKPLVSAHENHATAPSPVLSQCNVLFFFLIRSKQL